MDEACPLMRVPQEIIQMIVNHLSKCEKIALKLACPFLYIEPG